MNTTYKDFSDMHPLWRAVIAYNSYDYDGRENVISTTSIMKPLQMIVLERSNKSSDRVISIDGLVPSMYGTSIHDRAEISLNEINNDMWKLLGVPDPEKLEILTEIRNEIEIGSHIVSGKFDVMFKYGTTKWQLGDFKTMSVWGTMIDKAGKLEEFIKQMSIYRFLNQDKEIDDIAVVLILYTDWSKSDSIIKAKQGYPPSRIAHEDVALWSLVKTESYLKSQESQIVRGMETYAKTGNVPFVCSEKELWMKKSGFAYYAKAGAKRATKVCETKDEAEMYLGKAKDSTAYIEERKASATRCSYCSVVDFCAQYAEHVIKGLVKQ